MSPRRNRATCSRSRARLLRLRLALAASSDSSASDDASDDRTGRPRPSLEPLTSLESLVGGGGGQVSSSHASPLTNARANARLASLSRILASLTGSPHPKTVRFDRVARFSSNACSLVEAYADDDEDEEEEDDDDDADDADDDSVILSSSSSPVIVSIASMNRVVPSSPSASSSSSSRRVVPLARSLAARRRSSSRTISRDDEDLIPVVIVVSTDHRRTGTARTPPEHSTLTSAGRSGVPRVTSRSPAAKSLAARSITSIVTSEPAS